MNGILWLLAALAVPGNFTFSDLARDKIQKYNDCLESRALELEPSGAEFDDVFAAASTACSKQWSDVYLHLTDELKRAPIRDGKTSDEVAYDFTKSLREDFWKPEIRLKLLSARSDRNKK